MKNKIFCIGFPKTGTSSLEEALEILGYSVCKGHFNNNHTNYLISLFYNQDYSEIDKIIEYFDAFTDLPWGGTELYLYLSKRYPTARFIHTYREPKSWYNSLMGMFTKFDSSPDTAMKTFHSKGRYGAVYYMNREFNIDELSGNSELIIDHYIKTNNELIKYFELGNYLFLNFNIIEGDNWNKLCMFLQKPVPNIDFPHNNKSPFSAKTEPKKTRSQFNLFYFLKRIRNILIKT